MAKKSKTKLTPEQVVAKNKPNWKAVKESKSLAADAAGAPAEESSPELDQLRKKFLGEDAVSLEGAADAGGPDPASMVKVAPKNPADAPTGTKTVIVKGDKIIGEQG